MTTATDLHRGNVARFTPEGRRNRVTVLVDAVTTLPSGTLVMVHGVRLNANGAQDSQARMHAFPVRPDTAVEVTR